MRYALTIISLLAAAALSAASGAGPAEPVAVDTGASKKAVRAALGAPTVSRGTVRNDYGQVVEVWEYWGSASADAGCWYYFIGDQLVQRSVAGDWAEEPQRIAATLFSLGDQVDEADA